MTLRKKTTIILGVSSLILILLFFLVINLIINLTFKSYIKENQEKKYQNIVNYLSNVYDTSGSFSDDVILNIWHQAMMDNYYITILDDNENIIWGMNYNQHKMMGGNNLGNYIENTYLIQSENKPNIYVKIGQYSSSFFSVEDIKFKNNLNIGLFITAIFGLFLSILFGTIFAKQFSKPIIKLKETTDFIKLGNLDTRVDLTSNTKEIDDLKESINHLAFTLKEQEHLRKRLTSDISHELRTPLNVLLNQFEALIDGIWEPTKDRLEICRDEIYRLTNLVNDLEKLTKLDSNQFEIAKSNNLLSDIIMQVVKQFEPSFYSKGITFNYEFQENVYARVDKDKLIQVFYNILSNAYKFTEQNGSISINLQKVNNIARITISDTGIGISKEDIKHIFDRFYRVEQSRSRNTGGAGLGLSIVKGIINAHGGSVTVKSELKRGTTFIIDLPL